MNVGVWLSPELLLSIRLTLSSSCSSSAFEYIFYVLLYGFPDFSYLSLFNSVKLHTALPLGFFELFFCRSCLTFHLHLTFCVFPVFPQESAIFFLFSCQAVFSLAFLLLSNFKKQRQMIILHLGGTCSLFPAENTERTKITPLFFQTFLNINT